jgi:ABC-type polysaccharide/polyol phosphate export permease
MSSFLKSIKDEFEDLYRFRWVTFAFVTSSLKIRYKRSVLGIFWSMLGPASNYLIMGTVFSVLMKNSMQNYFAYMFSGAALYNFMSASINGGPGVIIHNESYIKKIYLPKSIFILNHILMEIVNFSFSVSTLFILGLIFGKVVFDISWIILPLIILLAALFLFGIVSLLGIATVYFRDVFHILPVAMQAAFFGTPVLYSIESVPEKYHYLIHLNPFYYFITTFRAPLFLGQWPELHMFLVVVVLSILSFLSGIFFLKYFDNKIVFRL